MSETKKERKAPTMGPRGWLNRSLHLSGKQTAEGFITLHRSFLEQGELASILSPVLAAFDSGELLPTPALSAMQNLVMGFVVESEVKAGEEAMARAQESPGTNKPWKGTIFDADGQIAIVHDEETGKDKPMTAGFEYVQRAEGWVNNRLFDSPPGWYGVVESTVITLRDGSHLSSRIEHTAAVTALTPKAKHPFVKNTGSKSSRLSFGVHAKPSHSSFSRG